MSSDGCASTGCLATAKTRGYCERHYRRRLHTGRYGYRDATAAREHVAELRRLGWTWQAIADTADLSTATAHSLHTGRTQRIWAESEAAILAVPLVRFESHRGVPSLDSRLRVQALAWMGWPCQEIARRVGCSPRSLPTELSRGRLSVRLAHRIAAVYEELALQPGPSKHARSYARRAGWLPPLALDDDLNGPPFDAQINPVRDEESSDSVDEIAIERAMHGDPVRLTKAERAEAVARMTKRGLSAAEIGRRLRRSERTVQRRRAA